MIKPSKITKKSVRHRIMLLTGVLVAVAIIGVGIISQILASEALKQKGEIILQNGVVQAIDLIEVKYMQFEAGITSEEEAKEEVKEILLGKMQKNGKREQHKEINLGESGYFIIYNSEGNEVMHPTLEGTNVWDVTDLYDDTHYVVREQIQKAKNGGGFLYYGWNYPDSNKIGEKISYGVYYEKWDWTVVATAYESDFDNEANDIIIISVMLMIILVTMVIAILSRYVHAQMEPIITVAEGMREVAKGKYQTLDLPKSSSEVNLLQDGYNHMVHALLMAESTLEIKNAHIEYLAYHDELTGLSNLHGFRELVIGRLKEEHVKGTMIQTDVAGMQIINSTLGYEEGDRLLAMLGEYFRDEMECENIVGRTSNNEFTFWIEEIFDEELEGKIYEILCGIKKFMVERGYGQSFDMYVAMAKYPEHGSSFDEVYEHTIMAMKYAKDQNDKNISIYNPLIKENIENEVLMRKYLEKAIEDKEIIAYYQEKVKYATGEVVGVEALARWISDDMGFISPGAFIPALTKLNLMNEFSKYMIEHVLESYQKITEKYKKEITISINIPPSYFCSEQFIEVLKKEIEKHNIPAQKVMIEITEDVFISDYRSIVEQINKVHEIGAKVSIDDFGTGFSSLNYLINMDFDEMKIDKSFIDKIVEDPKVFQLFKVLCNIAEIYGYAMVAEGVETKEQMGYIKETPVEIVQGYIYSKPEAL